MRIKIIMPGLLFVVNYYAFILKHIKFLVLLLLLIACSPTDQNVPQGILLDFRQVKTQSITPGRFPIKILGNLGDKVIPSQIISLKKYESYYYLLTIQDGVLVYDSEKNKIHPLATKGRGPGEIISASDVGISGKGNYVSIIDSGNRKIVTFNKSGQFINEVSVNQWVKNGVLVDEKNEIYLGATNGSKESNQGENYLAFLFDSHGEIKKGFNQFSKAYQAGIGNGINLHRLGQNSYGYYSVFTNHIYRYTDMEMKPSYTFEFSKPLLPDTLIIPHMQGKVPLNAYAYFLSYFESEGMLALTYELDRRKIWSVYNKKNDARNFFYLDHISGCGMCNRINVIGIDGHSLFVVVSSQMMERMIYPAQLDSIKSQYTDFDYLDFIIEVDLL